MEISTNCHYYSEKTLLSPNLTLSKDAEKTKKEISKQAHQPNNQQIVLKTKPFHSNL